MPDQVAPEPQVPPADRPRILAVDDTPANLLALTAILEPDGHALVTAGSGAEALALTDREEFAVILLDTHMPEMSGFETLERLRGGHAKDTPVIILTAYPPSADAIQRAYALGAFDFISKPVAHAILQGKVNAFVSFYNRGRELRRKSEALQAKDRHIRMLAHDLRTPLASMRLAAGLLTRHQEEGVRKIGAQIARASSRMERLSTDLLEFARAAALGIPIAMKEMDLCDLCREVLQDFEATYPQVQFTAEIPPEAIGVWDRNRLHQILANLLANAVKYGDGRVSLQLRGDAKTALLTIENCGEPIPPARLRDIFEPFVRGDDDGGGAGLGLHIAQEIARAHGGEIEASSDARRTRFTLRLPSAVRVSSAARAALSP
jgi:two-component system sensor histidine kinase/response regulator